MVKLRSSASSQQQTVGVGALVATPPLGAVKLTSACAGC